MTNSKEKVVARIQPGPVKGSRLVVDTRDGGLTIRIDDTAKPVLPSPPKS